MLEDLHAEKAGLESPPWRVEGARDILRDWYNGYRFAPDAGEAVYNPTLVFYFLDHLQRTGTYPEQMLDANLAADESKLESVALACSSPLNLLQYVYRVRPKRTAVYSPPEATAHTRPLPAAEYPTLPKSYPVGLGHSGRNVHKPFPATMRDRR